jgi:hypothetical protein
MTSGEDPVRSFHTIAVPHEDILAGRLTMDVFAADLWEVYKGRAPKEYADPDIFFRKTYVTQGLDNLFEVVRKRLAGKGGDPVIQLQTPFGGGKTHALIALYHKAKEWNAKTVVIVGTVLDTKHTVWGEMERQLTGKVEKMSGMTSPGREAIRELLGDNQPVLVLVDELLEYTTKAAGEKVGASTLASQTISFLQELVEVPGTLKRACVVVTLPSSRMEHYDEAAETMFQQLQKASGRTERIYTPVQDNEITRVIRRRLFSSIDEEGAESNVNAFLTYAEKEGLLPAGVDASTYRDNFVESFPFLPEVVDTLYQRWGSLTTFQRTRGVLRLLSLVIYSLRESGKPYVSLSDFDLADQDIRRELIKHTGNEFDSVVASDITGNASGSKLVDLDLGKSYRGLKIGTRASTAVFLYSFSGGPEKGAYLNDVKRAASTLDNPSSVVAEAAEKLKTKLFYLQAQDEKLFFSNKPNLNRIVLTKMENVKEEVIQELHKSVLGEDLRGFSNMKVFLWPRESRDVPDDASLKLIVLPSGESQTVLSSVTGFIETKGESPRVYKNTMFFLVPLESEREAFLSILRKRIAYETILTDNTLTLEEDQRKQVQDSLKKQKEDARDALRSFYRVIYALGKEGKPKRMDMGIPTFGEKSTLVSLVYDELRQEDEISEKIAPQLLLRNYLKNRDFVSTRQIYESMLRTPGETRPTGKEAVEYGFREGVKQGLFGLGTSLGEDKLVCQALGADVSVNLDESEVIMSKERYVKESAPTGYLSMSGEASAAVPLVSGPEGTGDVSARGARQNVSFSGIVEKGKAVDVMRLVNFLQQRFNEVQVQVRATNGSITDSDYAKSVKEALKQLGLLEGS